MSLRSYKGPRCRVRVWRPGETTARTAAEADVSAPKRSCIVMQVGSGWTLSRRSGVSSGQSVWRAFAELEWSFWRAVPGRCMRAPDGGWILLVVLPLLTWLIQGAVGPALVGSTQA